MVKERTDKYKSLKKRKRKGFCGIPFHEIQRKKRLEHVTGENLDEFDEQVPVNSNLIGGSFETFEDNNYDDFVPLKGIR